MLDGNLYSSADISESKADISESKVWFASVGKKNGRVFGLGTVAKTLLSMHHCKDKNKRSGR